MNERNNVLLIFASEKSTKSVYDLWRIYDRRRHRRALFLSRSMLCQGDYYHRRLVGVYAGTLRSAFRTLSAIGVVVRSVQCVN